MPLKLIVSDVDGCLTAEKAEAFEPALFNRLCESVRRCGKPGGPPPLALCTGRPQPYVELLMKLFDIHVPCACESGAVFYDLDANDWSLAEGLTQETLSELRRCKEWVEREICAGDSGMRVQFGKEAQFAIYVRESQRIPDIKAQVDRWVRQNGLPLETSRTELHLNVGVVGVDKQSAVEAIQRKLGVSREETAGIGDSAGDLSIRRAVGWMACPANAEDALKAECDYVSDLPETEGALDILSKLPELS